MPKASFATKDAVETSLGIQEGNVEILDAKCKIHQFPPNKKTGKQSAAFSCVTIKYGKLDADMDPVVDDDGEPIIEDSYYALGSDSIKKFHPGNIDDPDDDKPSDEGDDVDTEGNCINAIDGDAFNKKCKWMIFNNSLEKCNFKAAVLGTGYLPSLVGTKGHVITHKMDKIDGSDKDSPPTLLIFDKIVVFPYSDKGGKSKDKDKGKPETKKPATKSKKSDDDEPSDEETAARSILSTLAEKLSGQAVSTKKIVTMAQSEMLRLKGKDKLDTDTQKYIKGKLQEDDWYTEVGKDVLELVEEVDDGTVTFV